MVGVVVDAYDRLMEMPMFGHSDNHAGIQAADMICSAFLFPMAAFVSRRSPLRPNLEQPLPQRLRLHLLQHLPHFLLGRLVPVGEQLRHGRLQPLAENTRDRPPGRITSPSSGNARKGRWPPLRAGHAPAPNISVPTTQDPVPATLSPQAGPSHCADGTTPRPTGQEIKTIPRGVRAASFCYGYDARDCAFGPSQNCPHSLPPPDVSPTSGRPCFVLGLRLTLPPLSHGPALHTTDQK